MVWQPIMERLGLLRIYLNYGYNTNLDRCVLGGLALCPLVAIAGNRELRVNWRWLVVALGILGLFLLLPHVVGASYLVNVRLLPPLYFVSLAVLRIGRRANWIAVLAVALTALRVFDVATGFRNEAQANAVMDRGIDQIPRNVRLFGVLDDNEGPDPYDHGFGHYWDYAVIRRGAITGDLFDIAGQTPMRIIYEPYNYDFEDQPDDWKIIEESYDYIWCYYDKSDQGKISTFADKVFEDGPLTIYRVRER